MDDCERKTLLDVINKGLKSFIHRIIYVGEHTYDETSNTRYLFSIYKDISDRGNMGYCDVPVYGVLLTFPHHFFVAVEGSELTLTRHINMVKQSKVNSENIGTLKLIYICHNVGTRSFSTWSLLFSRSMTSIVDLKLPPEKIIEDCVEKVKILLTAEEEKEDPNSQFNFQKRLVDFPNYETVKFIISSKLTMDLESYAKMYMDMPKYSYSFGEIILETTWPAPYDYTPCLEPEPNSFDTLFVKLLSDISDFNVEVDELQNSKINDVEIKNSDVNVVENDKIKEKKVNGDLDEKLSDDHVDKKSQLKYCG